ncbi:MAG: L-histidine N(alpha)-methyltransferase [Actinomycetota bacterium]
MSGAGTLQIDVHLGPGDLDEALRAEALAGLTATPKELPSKWFYDEQGCALYDAITRLPEYYPTRREREILEARAGEIARTSRADTLVELGSGTSEKTRLLLSAMARVGTLRRFIPFDVSEPTLRQASEAIAAEYPGTAVHAVVGDFDRHLGRIPGGGRRLVAFLGSTIGNLTPDQRAGFLAEVAGGLAPGDGLLLGTDLVKDVARLEAAYNDAAGITAAFNLNVLMVLNRRLGANFDPANFEHRAVWVEEPEWIEMRLHATAGHTVDIPGIGRTVPFAPGEVMRTEISAKFRREGVEQELEAAGLELVHWWTDAGGDFGLSLSLRP